MDRRRKRTTTVVLLALGLLAALVALVLVRVMGAGPQASDSWGHVEEFQALADEHGDRAAGSSGYEAAARYVEQVLEDAGWESERQYFTFESGGEEYETFNVIAETESGDEGNVAMLGAHLDGVEDSAAINDNASGAAALLQAAQELGRLGEVDNTVRLVWWGAEEFSDSPGSAHYVQDLAENDSGALEEIAAYLNFDMLASPNPIIGVYDARNSGRSPLEVPEGSEQVMEIFTDYFEAQDQAWVPSTWSMASDQVAFIEEDIAVGGLFTGSDEVKSAREARLFGGAADQPRDPNYHTEKDDLDNIDPEALAVMTDAVVHAVTHLAQDNSTLD